MKLTYNIENGEIGAFGETLEVENYVEIDENIKNFILTKNVILDLSKIINGQKVSINDFIDAPVKVIEKTELEIIREKISIQDGAIMELAEIISGLGGV